MGNRRKITRLEEIPSRPVTIGGMEWNLTGTWRYLTPTPRDKMPPCRERCPAGVPIPQFVDAVKRGDMDEALRIILQENPLPGVTGRLCYHPCQTRCIRKELDRTIPISHLERFAADRGATLLSKPGSDGGAQVAIMGAGPLGLSCGYFLGRSGFDVTVYDPREQAGGLLLDELSGRLSLKALEREIHRLVETSGIRLKLNYRLNPMDGEAIWEGKDGVIIDPTAHSKGSPFQEWIELLGASQRPKKKKNLLFQDEDSPFQMTRPSQVAHAIGEGKRLAERVRGIFRGGEEKIEERGKSIVSVGKEDMRLDFFERAVRGSSPKRDVALQKRKAQSEAERCLSCGTCNGCKVCIRYCPDASIGLEPNKNRIVVDLDHCKGCGICAYECPRHVITMESDV